VDRRAFAVRGVGGRWLKGRVSAKGLGFAVEAVWCPSPSRDHRVEPYPVPKTITIGTHVTQEAGSKLTPTPFAVVAMGEGRSALVAVRADAGWHRWNFVDFTGTAGGVEVAIDLEGHTLVEEASGHVEVCAIPGHEGEGRMELLARGMAELYPSAAKRRLARSDQPDWWRRPIYCGWGDQVGMSLFLEGPGAEARALAYCTQGLYQRWIDRLDEAGVPFGTVIIDAGWSPAGVWRADPIKWPDLRGFIARQHARGRKVLLWIGTWLNDGLPDAWCLFAGKTKLVADPTNKGYRAFLRENVGRLLSDGKDGLGADGFKIDQLAFVPSERVLRGGAQFGRTFALERHPRIEFAGSAWGCELLYDLHKQIYDAAKSAKRDCLVSSSIVHPYFEGVFDMVRLHDTESVEVDVLAAMKARADLSSAVHPDAPIDMDDWVHADYGKWLDYTMQSGRYGVPCVFYAEHFVRSFGEAPVTLPIRLGDLRKIAKAWRSL